MNQNTKEYIDILIGLEPVFKQAGELALKMRGTAGSRNKFNTGVAGIDIVTEADLAVQEFIISEMAKTKLVECELIGEEDTPSVKKFKGTNGLVLTLDPIDGTLLYASTGRFWSTIVSLNDKKNVLYTFLYYPVLNWSRRITEDGVKDSGEFPEVSVKENLDFDLDKTIYCKDPKDVDEGIYKELVGEGYKFCKRREVTEEKGSYILLFSGKVVGSYVKNPNPYDGLVLLQYGHAKGMKIYSTLDLSKTVTGDHGPHYFGWYLVLQR